MITSINRTIQQCCQDVIRIVMVCTFFVVALGGYARRSRMIQRDLNNNFHARRRQVRRKDGPAVYPDCFKSNSEPKAIANL